MALPPPGPVVRRVLANGLRVLVQPLSGFTSAAVGIFILSGSRDEDPAAAGVSHFIEHLAFKGTPRRSARAIAEETDRLGGTLNAVTGKEYTSYYARVLGESLPQALDLLADLVRNPLFAEEDLGKEREVILQEISMVEDTPEDLVHDLLMERVWPGHSLGRPIMGTADTLRGLDRPAVSSFHGARYRPGSMLVAAAGRVDPDAFIAEVERHFGNMAPVPEAPPRLTPRTVPNLSLTRRDLEQVHLCAAFDSLRVDDERRYVLHLLNTVLGGGMSSRLFQSVREERGLAYSVYSYTSAFSDSGLLTIYCGTSPERFREVLDLCLQESERMGREEMSAQELASAKMQLKGNLLLGLESTSNLMNHSVRNEVHFGRQVSPDEMAAGIEAVTASQVRELAAGLLRRESLAVTVIGPLTEKAFDGLRP